MTEDEARTVAKLAAQYVWGGRRHLGLIMRYGRRNMNSIRIMDPADDYPNVYFRV